MGASLSSKHSRSAAQVVAVSACAAVCGTRKRGRHDYCSPVHDPVSTWKGFRVYAHSLTAESSLHL
eukprot:592330-Amphidinium_carterae.2